MKAAAVALLLLSLLLGTAPGRPALNGENDFASLYRRAVAARLAGQPAAAAEILGRLAQEHPDDADVQVQLGFAQLALGALDAARLAFEQALRLAPDYADARLGLALVAMRRGEPAEAAREARAVLASRPDAEAEAVLRQAEAALSQEQQEALIPTPRERPSRPGKAEPSRPRSAPARPAEARSAATTVRAVRKQAATKKAAPPAPPAGPAADAGTQPPPASEPAAKPPAWRLDLDGSLSRLTRGMADWHEGIVRIGYALRPGTVLSAAAELSRRFGRSDLYLEGRIDHRVDEALYLYAYAGGTPQADFRPIFTYGAGAAWRMADGAGTIGPSFATVDLSDALYRQDRVVKVSPGLVQYLFDGRLWATARWLNVFDESGWAVGYSLRADVRLGERLVLFSGVSQAPESADGVRIDVRSFTAGGTLTLGERSTLRFSYAFEDRDRGYDRSVYAVGIGVRF